MQLRERGSYVYCQGNHNIKIEYYQNIKQLESTYHTNKNKRKQTAEQAFNMMNILSTGMNNIYNCISRI